MPILASGEQALVSGINIRSIEPLLSPAELLKLYPADTGVTKAVLAARQRIQDIVLKKSDRFLVIVGPCSIHDEAAALEAIMSHLERLGTTCVYFSNDIDGTDAAFASATGTPEPFGLRPDFLVALIRELGGKFSLVGGDVMEVAPPLGEDASARKTTVDLAVRYLRETLEAVLGAPL